jgi:XTP/dITP diphosphohydrolase
MKTLVFATANPHKAAELQNMLGDDYQIKSLPDIGCHTDIPENEETLEGNALAKARYVKEHFGLDCFADDTGLEVEALDGRPGVLSARYGGAEKNPDLNMKKLLSEMNQAENRMARFRTVIALIMDGEESLFEGICSGRITPTKRGHQGFGYDPVFQPDGFDKTFAEMSMTEKATISHRGKAVEQLIAFLKNTSL